MALGFKNMTKAYCSVNDLKKFTRNRKNSYINVYGVHTFIQSSFQLHKNTPSFNYGKNKQTLHTVDLKLSLAKFL